MKTIVRKVLVLRSPILSTAVLVFGIGISIYFRQSIIVAIERLKVKGQYSSIDHTCHHVIHIIFAASAFQ